MFKHKIAQFIKKEQLIQPTDKVLVALSGGADSVALLKVLLSLGYCCEAAHCNFHLRGIESDNDEAFVRALCRELTIPLHVTQFDTTTYAAEKKISIEMAARELRYTWFTEVKEKCQASVIAVAHHQDDSVETILLNLIRGTGINGLTGIRPRRDDIVRPLLGVTRSEIVQYLNNTEQAFVTDSTNLSDEYVRNKIRLRLIPLMEEINPSARQSIAETGNHLSETASIYNRYIEERKLRVLNDEGIIIQALLNEDAPRTLLFEILHPLGFNTSQVDNIYQSLTQQPGKYFVSATGYKIIKDRTLLIIIHPHQNKDSEPKLVFEEKEYTPEFNIPKQSNIACLDADKIAQPLTLRKWKQGDSFVPFGMKGRKLVSDYMTDRKFSLIRKEQQWVLCSGENIVWLVGERTDNRFRVDKSTKRVLIISIH